MNTLSDRHPPGKTVYMRLLKAVLILLSSGTLSCSKDALQRSENTTVQQSNYTINISDNVARVKTMTGTAVGGYNSDTGSMGRLRYSINFNGNSLIYRMAFSNWKLTWIDKGYPVIDRGIGGTTFADQIPHIAALATDYLPNDLIVYHGENEFNRVPNGNQGVDDSLIAAFNTWTDIVHQKSPHTRIYIVSMLTGPYLKSRGFAAQIDQVNEGYKARAVKDSSYVKFLDIRALYNDKPAKGSSKPTRFDSDGIHVSLLEYPDWYNALKAVLPKPKTGTWGIAQVLLPVDTILSPPSDTDVAPPQPPADTVVVSPPPPPPTDTVVVPPPPPPPTDTVVVLPLPPTPPPSPLGKPIAIADNGGNGTTVPISDTVTTFKSWNYNPWIYGTKSKDLDGWITGYKWDFVSGPSSYKIVSPTSSKTRLDNLVIGTYVFRLTVTDNKRLTATDDVMVIIK